MKNFARRLMTTFSLKIALWGSYVCLTKFFCLWYAILNIRRYCWRNILREKSRVKHAKILLKHDFCPLDTLSKNLSFNFILRVLLKHWFEEIFGKFHGDIFLFLRVSTTTRIGPRLQKLLNGVHFRWKSARSNFFENLKPFRPDLAGLNWLKINWKLTKFLQGSLEEFYSL